MPPGMETKFTKGSQNGFQEKNSRTNCSQIKTDVHRLVGDFHESGEDVLDSVGGVHDVFRTERRALVQNIFSCLHQPLERGNGKVQN